MSRIRAWRVEQLLPVFGAWFTLAVAGFYWYVISRQGDAGEQPPRYVLLSLILAAAALATASFGPSLSLRLMLLAFGTSTLVIYAVVGAMSIGLFLVPAIALAGRCVSEARSRVPAATAWKVVSVGVLASLALAAFVFGLA